VASYIRDSLGLSEIKSSMLVNMLVSVYRYCLKTDGDNVLHRRLRELTGQRKWFGGPHLHIMLKRENLGVNHKRTERIYREEGLALRRKGAAV
jgi:putative transposase